MAFTKYASLESAQILDLKGSKERSRTASLDKIAEFEDYRTEDGYLYARIRAISSRVNKNHDGWPSVELAGGNDIFDKHTAAEGGFTVEADTGADYGYSTFLGKPIFVDHNNSNPERARGVIVDAKLHVDDHKTAALDPYYASDSVDSEHMPATWVELLLEVDANSFPKLAKAIVKGSKDDKNGIDGFSMGCDVDRSICNICKNSASSPDEYCNHIKMKGAHFDYINPKTGSKESRKSYENCYGIKFFEISAVFDPADETALLREVRSSHISKTAEAELPQSDLLHVPQEVNTLRKEQVCPVCGSTMDDQECDVCGYMSPPDGLDNPDLNKAKEGEEQEEGMEDLTEEATPVTNNAQTFAHVTTGMAWTTSLPARISGDNSAEAVGSGAPATEEPYEEILEDQDKPVTSSVRTAQEFIAAAGATRRNTMNHTADAASGAPAIATPDRNVDVVGVGGALDASNEECSSADAQIDVEGVGGVNGVGTGDETSENVSVGDEHSKNIEQIPTKTFGDGSSAVERQADPVSSQPFPASEEGVKSSAWTIEASDDAAFPIEDGGLGGGTSVQGTQPSDPMGLADDRVSVLDHVTSPANNSGATNTWSGTDGNGVTKQQEPVTNESLEGADGVTSSSHIFVAFKLADLEVELGLLEGGRKYERVAELEKQPMAVVEASLRYAQRVKTAGLRKSQKVATRLPSLGRSAATQQEEPKSDETPKEFLFGA